MRDTLITVLCLGLLASCSGGGSGGGQSTSPNSGLPGSVILGAGTNPAGISPQTPRFSFVSNDDPSTALYTVNPSSGQWRANGYVASGTTGNNAPGQVMVHPNGQFVYIPNIAENTISLFSIGANGFLTPLSTPSIASGQVPAAAGITPNGKFVYVANAFDNTISGFSVNSGTGLLTSLGPAVPTGMIPIALAIDPSGKFLYVANANDNSLSAFTINGGTGALTSIAGSPVNTGITPVSARVDAKGRLLVVANFNGNTVTTFAINAATGALSGAVTIPAGVNPVDAAMDLSGRFLFVANNGSSNISAFAIAPVGGLSVIAGAPFPSDAGPSAISVDPSGQFLYVGSESTRAVTGYAINSTTGVLTRGTTVHTRGIPNALTMFGGSAEATYTPRFAYVSNEGSNNVSAFDVNPITGALTSIAGSPFASDSAPSSIAVDRTGRFVYAANSGTLIFGGATNNLSGFEANTNSGVLTALSPVIEPYFTLVGPPNIVATDFKGNLYLATNNTQTTVSYRIPPSTGRLIDIGGNQLCGSSLYQTSSALALDPIGRAVYRTNKEANTICTYTEFPLAGNVASTGIPDIATGNTPSAVAVEPTGQFAYVANKADNTISVYNINPSDGSLTASGVVPSNGTGPNSITIEPTGRFLYISHQTSNSLSIFSINPGSASLTTAGTAATGALPRFVTVDPSGKFLYVANGGANTISIYSLDVSTGALTTIGTVPSGSNPSGIAVAFTIQ